MNLDASSFPSRIRPAGSIEPVPSSAPTPAVDEATFGAMTAKADAAASAAPVVGVASSALKGMQDGDDMQVAGDVLRLGGTVLKDAAVASPLLAGGNLLLGVDQALEGETYGAATSVSTAVEKLSPALAKTGLGAAVNVAVVATGGQKVAGQQANLAEKAKALVNAKEGERLKAASDLALATQQTVTLYRSLVNSAVKLGGWGLTRLGRVEGLGHVASKAQAMTARVAASPLGRSLKFLNKWIPLINIAGLAFSAKTAHDVFKEPASSKTSKALALASTMTAAASVWGGIALGGWAFAGLVAGSIAIDLGLARSRSLDADAGDTDARFMRGLAHPVETATAATRWTLQAVPALGRWVIERVARAFRHAPRELAAAAKPPAVAPDRPLVG